MDLSAFKITVIGAGIGGLTAALCLRRLGAQVTILEQAECISEVGAGLQISPNGACVLHALDLPLSEISVPAEAVVLRDYAQGRQVLRLDLKKYASDQSYHFVHRADLIDMLAQAARVSGVQIRLLQQVKQVIPADRPVIEMKSGAQKTSDFVVGADGLHSQARIALNGSDTPFFTGQVAWRATVPNEFGLRDEATVFMGPGRHLVCYPLRGGSEVNVVAVQERDLWAAEGWHHPDDAAQLRAAFSGFKGQATDILATVANPFLWGLFRHPVAQNWCGSNVAILGDAAHPTLPFLAQGANLAIEDAWVLSDCLARAENMDQALASYAAQRQPRARKVIEAANGNAWKYHLRNPLIRGAAHMALSAGGRFAPGKMVRQFDWLYRHDVTAR